MFYLKATDPVFMGASLYHVSGCMFTPLLEKATTYETRDKALEIQLMIKNDFGLETEIV